MYTVLGISVIALLFGIWSSRNNREYMVVNGFGWTCIGLVCGLLVALVISTFGTHKVNEQFSETKLLAMRSSDALNGSFLFASGNIGENIDYVYYYETSDGGYRAGRVNAESSHVTVYEVEGLEGGTLTVIQCLEVRNEKWTEKFVLWTNSSCGFEYEFRIPEGSLVQQFNIQ